VEVNSYQTLPLSRCFTADTFSCIKSQHQLTVTYTVSKLQQMVCEIQTNNCH